MDQKNQHIKQISYFTKEFKHAKTYKLEAWQKSYVKRIKKFLLDKNYANKTLLDVGCGSGYMSIEMAKLGLKVFACDITPQSIKNLNSFSSILGLKNLKTLICPAEKLPFKDNQFDFVVANAILEHIENEEKAISEWKRVLKPKGKLFVTVPLKLKYTWPFFWPIHLIHDYKIGHLRRYDEKILAFKFGLKIYKIFYTGHFLKMIGVLTQAITKTKCLDNYLEKIDSISVNKKFGASNLSVAFQK